jgi:hypothetical protein
MKFVVEMALGDMIYIPSFKKISTGVRKLLRGMQTQKQSLTQHGELISLVLFFQN